MKLPVYLGLLEDGEGSLAAAFRLVGEGHAAEADVFHMCHTLAQQCEQRLASLAPAIARYGRADAPAAAPHPDAPDAPRSGPVGLIRDLHGLFARASFVEMNWTIVQQAAKALRDEELLDAAGSAVTQTGLQLAWLRTRLKEAAPQALVAAS